MKTATRWQAAGLACGLKNTGIGNGMPDESSAMITIEAPDHVIIDHGWTEMGQGVNTIAAQVVCEETGIDPSLIEVRIDTKAEQLAGIAAEGPGGHAMGVHGAGSGAVIGDAVGAGGMDRHAVGDGRAP